MTETRRSALFQAALDGVAVTVTEQHETADDVRLRFEVRERALAIGVNAFLAKPLDPGKMIGMLASIRDGETTLSDSRNR